MRLLRGVRLDFFFADAVFFFFTDDCAAAVLPAAETTGAALTRSTAPRIQSQVFLVIGYLGGLPFETQGKRVKLAPRQLLLRSWDRTGEVHRIKLFATRAAPDFEQDIFPGLHSRDDTAVVRNRRNG